MSERFWTKEEWERVDGPRDHSHPITAATLDNLYGLCAALIRQRDEARSPDWYEADLMAHRETERGLRAQLAAAEEAAHSALDLLEAERQKTVALETELGQAKIARAALEVKFREQREPHGRRAS